VSEAGVPKKRVDELVAELERDAGGALRIQVLPVQAGER
jgi:hypothetical protein